MKWHKASPIKSQPQAKNIFLSYQVHRDGGFSEIPCTILIPSGKPLKLYII